MIATPTLKDAYRLMHEGAIALSHVEKNGIRINTQYLSTAIDKVEERIARNKQTLQQDEIYEIWRRTYRENTNLGSREQLGNVLFKQLDYESRNKTPSGRFSTDDENLRPIKEPFVQKWLQTEKLKKLRNTYLEGILREVEGEYLHPFFNLHFARTYRSSSDSINFQNIPIRDPQQGKIIRRAFIPREGHTLVEIDYSAIEVRVAACYHKDPTMLKYIEDDYDLHKDMAAECFKLKKEQVTKPVRHMGKNGFVFPSFYGDYAPSISENLWHSIARDDLSTEDGVPLYDHLKKKGITSLGYAREKKEAPRPEFFTQHIQDVFDRFWNDRFPIYTEWKEDWWSRYLKHGSFQMKTGFRCSGVMKRNDVINYPVQGAAFHCLLWSLIQLNKWLRKNKMRTLIIGQIHDSMILDVLKKELDDVLHQAKYIMCTALRQHWPWIITPLAVEAEGSDVNWHEKEAIAI